MKNENEKYYETVLLEFYTNLPKFKKFCIFKYL